MRKFVTIYILLALMVSSCAQLGSVSTTSIPPQRDQKVSSEAYRFIFLLLNFNNKYVDSITQDLANQCPEGRVEGILTKDERIMYFPLIAHAVRVSAEGYCVPFRTKKRVRR